MEKRYVLSNGIVWFYRFDDSGFKNKWTGLWLKDKKFLEYFAFKVNGEWLSPKNVIKFSRDAYTAKHLFALTGLKVEESIKVLDNLPGVSIEVLTKNESDEKVEATIEMELAANIRMWNENWHDRKYSVKRQQKMLEISSDLGTLLMNSEETFEFIEDHYYKDHTPSGDLQRCFIPGVIRWQLEIEPKKSRVVKVLLLATDTEFNTEKISSFNFGEYERITKENWNEIEKMIKTPDNFVDKIFKISAENIKKLFFKPSFFAGFPWYVQYWCRDILWMSDAAINLGMFEEVRSSLKYIAKHQLKNGLMPNIISKNPNYNSSDSTPLWIIELHKYVHYSGDVLTLFDLKDNLIKSFEFYISNASSDKLIPSGKNTTWCDTIERGKFCIDIQSLWYKALNDLSDLFYLMDEDVFRKEAMELSIELGKSIKNKFKVGNFYVDNLDKKYRSINAIFPLMFVDFDKSILKQIESDEFTTSYGVRTLSCKEPMYNPSGYHTGSSWGFTTALVSLLEFMKCDYELGKKYLYYIHSVSSNYTHGSLIEAWNSETGEIMLDKPIGREESAFHQGWSSANVIKSIDEGLFGIDVDSLTKTIYLKPCIQEGKYMRKKRIGTDWVDLSIERKGTKVKVDYKSVKGIKYKIVLLPRV